MDDDGDFAFFEGFDALRVTLDEAALRMHDRFTDFFGKHLRVAYETVGLVD